MNSKINSKRVYAVVFIEGRATVSHPCVKLSDFFTPTINDEDDTLGCLHEWKYACQDHIDEILDLCVDERMQMFFNRDNQDSLGIIKRIA